MALDSSCFGPVLSVVKPNFPLHPLCTVWQPMSDVDFDRFVATAKRLGGIFNNPATSWNTMHTGNSCRHYNADKCAMAVSFQGHEEDR